MLLKGIHLQKCKDMEISWQEIIFHICQFQLIPFTFTLILGDFYLILIVSTVVEKLVQFYVFYVIFLY